MLLESGQEAVSVSNSEQMNLYGSTVMTVSSRQQLSRNTRSVTFTVT